MAISIMKDPYLDADKSVKRLIKDYYTHNENLIVAFDFDNTVYDFHKAGYTFNRAITC